mmetsp:Transcript_11949/g.27935  ORF Transcript_11949/g.27935 Transcript_11949/m.27935 type:complete len:80 (+) Transcript_11949:1720-1959(+)
MGVGNGKDPASKGRWLHNKHSAFLRWNSAFEERPELGPPNRPRRQKIARLAIGMSFQWIDPSDLQARFSPQVELGLSEG